MTTSRRNKQITVTLSHELYEQLMVAVEAEDLTIVQWCRRAIRARLEQPNAL